MQKDFEEVRNFWDSSAGDWEIQVGNDGDSNRQINSDPVLWQLAGNIKGLRVLDAGCGTGYLCRKLSEKGAKVTGVDISSKMIEIAKRKNPDLKFLVDSCSNLKDLHDSNFDLIISNYVLMDTPDLPGTLTAFARVLKPGAAAVLIFSHPCFPQGRTAVSRNHETIDYRWEYNYFEDTRCTDPPWGHFSSSFIWFHRPLSSYWKAFRQAGFSVADMEEPRATQATSHLAQSPGSLKNNQTRPYSIAFKIVKN